MSRVRSLHALAWSLPDVQPAAKLARSGAASGEVASEWRLCDSCDGNGSTMDRFRRQVTCSTCGGRGRFRVDQMTGGRVSTAEHPAPARTRRVLCDCCGGTGVTLGRYSGVEGLVRCPRCDGAGKVSVPIVEREPAGKAFDGTARSRLRARGDWDALEAALELLRDMNVQAWRYWRSARVDGLALIVGEDDGQLEHWDRWLLERLPDPLRVPRDVMTAFEARKERQAMREAARLAKGGQGGGRKRAMARELILRGYAVQEAARLAGCSVKTARRAAA